MGEVKNIPGMVSRLPVHNGDGYSWGGDFLVIFGDQSVNLGCGRDAEKLATLLSVAPEILSDLEAQHAWLLHWRDDVKGGLKPTLESLEKRLEAVVALKAKAMGADNG